MHKRNNIMQIGGFAVGVSVTFLLGCDMVRTEQRIIGSEADPIACTSNAGSYALPKSFLRFTVKEMTGQGKRKEHVLQAIEQVRKEDRLHTYCLQYRGAITSDDTVYVRKAKAVKSELVEAALTVQTTARERATGDAELLVTRPDAELLQLTNLLHVVSSKAIDRSAEIVQNLVKSVFDIGTGLSRSTRALFVNTGKTVLEIEFDPFEPYQTAEANQALADLGFCAVLGGYNFDLHQARIDQYCNNPMGTLKTAPPIVDGHHYEELLAEYRAPLEELPNGILYRPEMTYTLYVFGRDEDKTDPKHEWLLKLKEEVQLENISPLVAVRLTRTYFAQRRTDLVFIGGVLQNVCIQKTAPLVEAVKLPLVVVKSIIALPTRILQLKIDSASNRAEVVKAQQEVLRQQKAQLDAMTKREVSEKTAEFKFVPVAFTDPQASPISKAEPTTGEDFVCPNFSRVSQAQQALDDSEKQESAQ